MPNQGPITKDLNGGNLSIKGKIVIDGNKNAKLNSLKVNELNMGGKVSGTSDAFNENSTAITLNGVSGTITTPSASTSADSAFDIDMTNTDVTSNSLVFGSISNYNGSGRPVISQITPGSGIVTFTIANVGTVSLNAAVTVSFLVVN